jgi:hypothetical protein
MALNFEQELSKPLITDPNEAQLLSSGGFPSGGLMLPILEPTFQIKFSKFQETQEFISDLKLNYPTQKMTSLTQEIGFYIFYFNVRIVENNTNWE